MTALVLIAMLGQTPTPPDLLSQTGTARRTYESIKGYILKSAEKMPAEHFTFQPTPDVRSFGQVLAHIVDANYLLCSPAAGAPSPNGEVMQKTENDKLDRAAMLAKLNESFALCDKAYANLTDANMNDPVDVMNSKRPRLGVLWFQISHAFEHYGNLVTYMRLKGIVPPSSARS